MSPHLWRCWSCHTSLSFCQPSFRLPPHSKACLPQLLPLHNHYDARCCTPLVAVVHCPHSGSIMLPVTQILIALCLLNPGSLGPLATGGTVVPLSLGPLKSWCHDATVHSNLDTQAWHSHIHGLMALDKFLVFPKLSSAILTID